MTARARCEVLPHVVLEWPRPGVQLLGERSVFAAGNAVQRTHALFIVLVCERLLVDTSTRTPGAPFRLCVISWVVRVELVGVPSRTDKRTDTDTDFEDSGGVPQATTQDSPVVWRIFQHGHELGVVRS